MDLETLIQQAKDGDRDALGELLEQNKAFLDSLVSWRLGSSALRQRIDPADVVQEVHAKVCDSFSFRGNSKAEFTAWLMKIAENTVLDLAEKHGARMRDVMRERPMWDASGSACVAWCEPQANDTTPSQRLMRGEQAFRLLTCLNALPPDQREAVKLRHLEGCSTHEICERMNRSTSSVAGLLQRGIRRLRELLDDDTV